MKSILRSCTIDGITYDALMFVCPGCVAGGPDGYDGIHLLPVNVTVDIGKPSWEWNGDLEKPTLSPSILSQGYCRCHSFLRDGIFEFLSDSDHSLSGSFVTIPELPEWAQELSDDTGEADE